MDANFIIKDFKFWRKLINFWSLVFFIGIIYDFFTNNSLTEMLNVFSIIYISVLAIYVGNKEFERWYDNHRSQHPGELFVIIWTFLVILLIVFGLIFKRNYVLPESVISSYIAVLTILAITNKSKELYKFKCQRDKNDKQQIYANKKTNKKNNNKKNKSK